MKTLPLTSYTSRRYQDDTKLWIGNLELQLCYRGWKDADGTLIPMPERHTPAPDIILQVYIRCNCKSRQQLTQYGALPEKRNSIDYFIFSNARCNNLRKMIRNIKVRRIKRFLKVLIVELGCIKDAVQNT